MNGLIVEDDVRVARSYKKFLKKYDYHFDLSFSKEDALKRIQQHKYPLLILDLRLPDGDGCDLITPLRSLYPHIKIIVVSGLCEEANVVKVLDYGVDEYLRKPMKAFELRAHIDAIQRRPQALNVDQKYDIQEVLFYYKSSYLEYKGKKIPLTKMERILLKSLVDSSSLVSYQDLKWSLWGHLLEEKSEDALQYHISSLKQKFKKLKRETEFIRNTSQTGYELIR